MVAAASVGAAYAAYPYFSQRKDTKEDVAFFNPFELAPALKFGLIYEAILLVSRAAQLYLGNTGIYISSIAGGLADADAITLSMAEPSTQSSRPDLAMAARATVLAAISNTTAKRDIILAYGSHGLRRALLPGLLLMLVVGFGTVFLL